jgi:3-oxoacyl-[acyl-carrier protein] reductase
MFAGRSVIVSGAARGIGAAAARLYAREGAKVVLTDIDADVLAATAKSIDAEEAGSAMAFAGDITDKTFPEKIIKATVDANGGLDVLVNNAGFTWDGMLHKMSDDQWDAIVDCHGGAVFRMIRAASPFMRDAGKAEMKNGGKPQDRCVINVSSTSGLHGNTGQANYAFAKLGVVGLTKTVAKEWGSVGVRSNCVAFGMINTRLTEKGSKVGEGHKVGGKEIPQGMPDSAVDFMKSPQVLKMSIPLARPGEAEEGAGGILLMSSPLASYITGHTLEVTGGMGI